MSEKFLIESAVSRETHAIRTFFIHVPLGNFVWFLRILRYEMHENKSGPKLFVVKDCALEYFSI